MLARSFAGDFNVRGVLKNNFLWQKQLHALYTRDGCGQGYTDLMMKVADDLITTSLLTLTISKMQTNIKVCWRFLRPPYFYLLSIFCDPPCACSEW